MANVICNNFAFLIESDGQYHDWVPGKPDSYYVFNLDTLELQKLPFNDQESFYPACNQDEGRVELATSRVIDLYLSDLLHPKIYDFTNLLDAMGVSEKSGLYVADQTPVQNNLLFADIEEGQGGSNYPERVGLYRIDLNNNKSEQFTYPGANSGDEYIYYKE